MEVVIKNKVEDQKNIISMSDMEPLQVGRLISPNKYQGKVVMRSCSSAHFEIMLLNNECRSWTVKNACKDIKVEIDPNPKLTIELSI